MNWRPGRRRWLGTWPDKTVMVLEAREAESKGSINPRGQFQGAALTGFKGK